MYRVDFMSCCNHFAPQPWLSLVCVCVVCSVEAYPLPLGLALPEGHDVVLPADVRDRAVLGVVFQQCHGQRWLRQTGWASESDERHGVTWTIDRSCVTKLEIGSNRLAGEIGEKFDRGE